jgi:hypothetical protein
MSQNSQNSGESEPTVVSDGPQGRAPRWRPRPSAGRTSQLEAFRPASGPLLTDPQAEGEGETRPALPMPRALRPKRPPISAAGSRRRRRPKQPRPSFRGPRLADFIGWWRRLRSIVFLVVITVILGMILAAIVAVAVGAIVVGLQHALKSG